MNLFDLVLIDRARIGLAWRTRRSAVALIVISALIGGCGTPRIPPAGDALSDRNRNGPDAFELSVQADRAYRDSRWLDAARHYAQLTRQVPDDAYAWFRLGNTQARQGDYTRAITSYESSLERDSAQPKPWFNLATAHLLHAQAALLQARERLRHDDPARAMIDVRLEGLRSLVHGRIEDVSDRVLTR